VPYVALFIADETVEVATDPGSVICTIEVANTEAGIDELADWLRNRLPGDSEPTWVATVPSGDGGPVYAWLAASIPDLFLQNPASLRAFAAKANANWQSARTLLSFQRSKAW
jgi:hypothetical protein